MTASRKPNPFEKAYSFFFDHRDTEISSQFPGDTQSDQAPAAANSCADARYKYLLALQGRRDHGAIGAFVDNKEFNAVLLAEASALGIGKQLGVGAKAAQVSEGAGAMANAGKARAAAVGGALGSIAVASVAGTYAIDDITGTWDSQVAAARKDFEQQCGKK